MERKRRKRRLMERNEGRVIEKKRRKMRLMERKEGERYEGEEEVNEVD